MMTVTQHIIQAYPSETQQKKEEYVVMQLNGSEELWKSSMGQGILFREWKKPNSSTDVARFSDAGL